jgi:hypothetical protein
MERIDRGHAHVDHVEEEKDLGANEELQSLRGRQPDRPGQMSDGMSSHCEPLTKHTAHPAWIQLAIANLNPTPWIKVSLKIFSEVLFRPTVAEPRHRDDEPEE